MASAFYSLGVSNCHVTRTLKQRHTEVCPLCLRSCLSAFLLECGHLTVATSSPPSLSVSVTGLLCSWSQSLHTCCSLSLRAPSHPLVSLISFIFQSCLKLTFEAFRYYGLPDAIQYEVHSFLKYNIFFITRIFLESYILFCCLRVIVWRIVYLYKLEM